MGNCEIVTKIGYITVLWDWEFTELVIVGKVLFSQLKKQTGLDR